MFHLKIEKEHNHEHLLHKQARKMSCMPNCVWAACLTKKMYSKSIFKSSIIWTKSNNDHNCHTKQYRLFFKLLFRSFSFSFSFVISHIITINKNAEWKRTRMTKFLKRCKKYTKHYESEVQTRNKLRKKKFCINLGIYLHSKYEL